jgi:dynein assembly factor 1, axonemal
VVPFFSELPNLIALYLKGNPAARLISNYRKALTMAMPGLFYLDERPIFENERLLADAFARGGKEEEERVRLEWAEKQKTSTEKNT